MEMCDHRSERAARRCSGLSSGRGQLLRPAGGIPGWLQLRVALGCDNLFFRLHLAELEHESVSLPEALIEFAGSY